LIASLAGTGALIVLAALCACGGGSSSPLATVTTASASASHYGAAAMLTITGANLDNISVGSPGCKNITRLTSAPTASTSTTAYYACTVSGAFTSTFTITSNGQNVGQAGFTVPPPIVTLRVTNHNDINGDIVLALAGDKMPVTVDNFLAYLNQGFYTNTIFHRVVAGFVAQGGEYGPTNNGQLPASPKQASPAIPPIPLEVDPTLKNVTWSIAMANGGSPPMSTSSFYINLANNTNLDGGFAVFGTITAGTDVVQQIVASPAVCKNNPLAQTTDCLPQPDVVITSAVQTQ
jgi:peptidyl-prolyl cis-trans isomerase A (cyclophilin A)